ncbi:MAG: YeeE/YedE thiosulfate transporter family protein [Halomonas sp.]|uniref:YeeE/YedE family protein n=1 Tax=Halomonas sp. TaxID=1486246 RepID=UPI002ACD5E41|nr:YeeE/YedE thiosulfate transporter family protein [Halomonas sp.]MDZ7852586.1 YeeE/YedE thiosulfate transporter family protein [Halomonas sp.]
MSRFGDPRNLIMLLGGGFLVGFGTRYGNGCTSGHAIMGLSLLSFGSLVATVSFFLGGLLVSNLVLPALMTL